MRGNTGLKKQRVLKDIVFVLLLIAIDYFTKQLAVRFLKGQENIVLIKNVLELEYLENFGAAFSSFMGKRGLLVIITALVMLFLVWKLLQLPDERHYFGMRFCILFVFSGALGNFIDRVVSGYVVDFIYFVPIDFPKFNFADICVTCGVVLLGFFCFFYYEEKDLDLLLSLKKKA